MTNAEGVNETLERLGDEGLLAEVSPAVMAMVRGLAAAVDAEPDNAALWREYRAALGTLKEEAAGGSDDDTASFLVSIQTPRGAKVGNSSES